MASLQQLLNAEEESKHIKYMKNRTHVKLVDSVLVNHQRKRLDSTKQRIHNASTRKGSSKRVTLEGETSKSNSIVVGDDAGGLDDIAIKSVISMLSGYIGRYLKDVSFRERFKDKCNSCLIRRTNDSDNEIFANIELVMEGIERLIVVEKETIRESRMKSLRNSIRLLSIVASLNGKELRNGSTCGVPNSHLSACAHLCLSIVYKLEKNDSICARHLLRVFCESPFLARTHLLPDLWDLIFLPHLLHLKVWYHEELEFLSMSQQVDKEKRMKILGKVYSDQMDKGTIQFALYYNEWLKVGGKAPSLPSVPLPSKPSYPRYRRRSMDTHASNSPVNRNLYRAVFGPAFEARSVDLDSLTKASTVTSVVEEDCIGTEEDGLSHCKYVTENAGTCQQRHSSQDYRTTSNELWVASQLPAFRLFSCQNTLSECLMNGKPIVKSTTSTKKEEGIHPSSKVLSRAISTTCKSDSLGDCELSIRVITKAWLDSHGDPAIESALSKAPIIEGMLEVLFASNDDEVLELAISMLAEFAVRKATTRLIVLSSDPQLEIFQRLLKSSSLFLKAAVLLYLLKPKAKQMISTEWVMLALRVLEFGDQLQTLFTVRCMPRKSAMYLLDQLLTGFSEDKNMENASQVVFLGGLSMLVKCFELVDFKDRDEVAALISCCIRADASSKTYLVDNLSKTSLLELIVHGIQHKTKGHAMDLLAELLCLHRTQAIEFLRGLRHGRDGLNAMHIFEVYLQRASPTERPLVAAILLQLDILGDPSKFSMFKEEAIEAITEALDCQKNSSKVQEQSARALLMLGGCFSGTLDATAEDWLLQQTSFPETSATPHCGKERIYISSNEEERVAIDWLRKLALVLLNCGGKVFLNALSNSIAYGTPTLAQASLFTVAWMNRILISIGNQNFQSILVPQLQGSLHCERLFDGSLRDVIKSPECVSVLSTLDKELIDPLRNPY